MVKNKHRLLFVITAMMFIAFVGSFTYSIKTSLNVNAEDLEYNFQGAYCGVVSTDGFSIRLLTDRTSISGTFNSQDVEDQRTKGYFLVNDKPITEESDVFYHGSYYQNNSNEVFYDGNNETKLEGYYYLFRYISWNAVDTIKNADNSASFTISVKKGNHLGSLTLKNTYKIRVNIDDVTKRDNASIKIYEVITPNIKEYNFTNESGNVRLLFYFNTNIKTNLSNIVPPFRSNILVNGVKLGDDNSGSCYFCTGSNNMFQLYVKQELLKDVNEENVIVIPKGSILSESEALAPTGNYNVQKMGRIIEEDITFFVIKGDGTVTVRFGTSMGKPYQRFGYNFAFPININERFGDQSLNGYVENWRADYFLFNGEEVTISSTEKYYQGYFTYAENLIGYDKSSSFAHYYTSINQNYLKSLDTDGNGEVSITLTYKKGARFSYYYILDRDYTYRFDFKNVNNDSPSSSDILITELFETASLEIVKGKESDMLLLKSNDLNNNETIRVCKTGETYSIKPLGCEGLIFDGYKVVDENDEDVDLDIVNNNDGTYSFTIPNNYVKITPIYIPEQIRYASVSLNGNIGLNFYALLNVEPTSTVEAKFSFDGKETFEIGKYDYDTKCFVFSYGINPKDYLKDVTISIVGKESITKSLSVKGYADMLDDQNEAYDLATKMIDYCESSRIFFDNEALSQDKFLLDVNLDVYKPLLTDIENEVTILGGTLVVESKTSILIYFTTVKDINDVEVSNAKVETVNQDEKLYVAIVSDIVAKDLDKTFTIEIDGDIVEYSALSYVYSILSKEKIDTKLNNIVISLYKYWNEAESYFGEGV